jgi:hypothetical protein
MAMDAILATVSNVRQAIVDIDREAGRNKLIFHSICYLILNPLMVTLSSLFCRGSRGWGMFHHINCAAGQANSSIMGGMFVCLCFASQKPSQQAFFVPPRTDFVVKL